METALGRSAWFPSPIWGSRARRWEMRGRRRRPRSRDCRWGMRGRRCTRSQPRRADATSRGRHSRRWEMRGRHRTRSQDLCDLARPPRRPLGDAQQTGRAGCQTSAAARWMSRAELSDARTEIVGGRVRCSIGGSRVPAGCRMSQFDSRRAGFIPKPGRRLQSRMLHLNILPTWSAACMYSWIATLDLLCYCCILIFFLHRNYSYKLCIGKDGF